MNAELEIKPPEKWMPVSAWFKGVDALNKAVAILERLKDRISTVDQFWIVHFLDAATEIYFQFLWEDAVQIEADGPYFVPHDVVCLEWLRETGEKSYLLNALT